MNLLSNISRINELQQLFVVIYPILYGIMLSACIGLGLFHFGEFFHPRKKQFVRRRIFVSLFLINILPIIIFSIIFIWLDSIPSIINIFNIMGIFFISFTVFICYRILHVVISYDSGEWFYDPTMIRKNRMHEIGFSINGHIIGILIYVIIVIIGFSLIIKSNAFINFIIFLISDRVIMSFILLTVGAFLWYGISKLKKEKLSETDDENFRNYYPCPICRSTVVNGKCSYCRKEFIDINIARRSALIEYYSSGMSTHAGLFAGLVFGQFQITQLLLSGNINSNLFIHYFILLVILEMFGFYIINRFTGYRNAAMRNETMVKDFRFLQIPSLDIAKSCYETHLKNNSKTLLQKTLSSLMIRIYYIIIILYIDFLVIIDHFVTYNQIRNIMIYVGITIFIANFLINYLSESK